MKAPRWWDEARADYEPNNPFLNTNMIWIAGVTPYAIGVPAILIYQWLCR